LSSLQVSQINVSYYCNVLKEMWYAGMDLINLTQYRIQGWASMQRVKGGQFLVSETISLPNTVLHGVYCHGDWYFWMMKVTNGLYVFFIFSPSLYMKPG
jgi:hypothetical protein